MTGTRTSWLTVGLLIVASSLPLTSCTSDPSASSSAPSVSVTAVAASLPTPSPDAIAVHRAAPVTPAGSSAAVPVTTASTAEPTNGGKPGPTVISTATTGTPQGAAVAWLTALRTASFRDSASGWVNKITPYVTPALNASYQRIAAGGKGGGADWAVFVAHKCVSAVVNAAGVVPAEAPATATAAHVQVSATLATVCRAGTTTSTEFIAATVLVTKQHSRWAVARREF